MGCFSVGAHDLLNISMQIRLLAELPTPNDYHFCALRVYDGDLIPYSKTIACSTNCLKMCTKESSRV